MPGSRTQLYLEKPFHGRGQFRRLLAGPLCVFDSLPEAVLDVVIEQDERDRLRGGDDARDLVRISTQ